MEVYEHEEMFLTPTSTPTHTHIRKKNGNPIIHSNSSSIVPAWVIWRGERERGRGSQTGGEGGQGGQEGQGC